MAFTDEQKANAAIIVSVGRSLGATDRDLQIALMTAMQESGLRNLNYGDRDSVGLFQQRNAWGSFAKRTNPYESAKMFFLGGEQGQRGLFDFKTRDQMSLTQAAQAVQVSAFPDAYAKHESGARELLGGVAGGNVPSGTSERTAPTQPLNPPTTPLAPPTTTFADNTVAQTAAAARAPLPEQASGPVGIRMTAPAGVNAALAPGTEAAGAMGIGAVNGPDSPDMFSTAFPTLDRDQFAGLFPDAGVVFGGGDGRRGAAITAAMGFIGTPYTWGGNTRSGVDCSGLVQTVYAGLGIDLPRISAEQARAGARVGLDALRPGDLVAWDNSSRNNGADHIAIYAGDGYIIEAPRPGLAVRKRKLGSSDFDEAYGVQIAQLG